ncbi:hypothetical protein AT00_01640 [Pseudoalteromonas lipolytica SCSIO 04301]|uniref:hypothetical protein n=1 Tax=Pseudoalteromonas lipolytica TaxID=570156 RepID=UPI00044EDAB5|nr:hypothetical protein [Pseudoalteromonas lipolytica]EWH07820.1 hypothetical protein AT00_01640 [Pseudoalteromonas lipolytica SCSIO 04301]
MFGLGKTQDLILLVVTDIANKYNVKKGDVEQVLSGKPVIKELRRRIRFYRHRQQARRALIATLYTLKTPTITLLRYSTDKEYVWLFKHDKACLNAFKESFLKKLVY